MGRGYDATIYDRPVADLADKIIEISTQALDDDDARALAPLADLIAARTTLARLAEEHR